MIAYFLSDLHLGAPYFPDSRAAELKVVRFLDSIRHDADAIYLVGDILDYWYEYRYVVPRGFVRFFGKLAELADSGIKIYWYIGNHDIWIFDYLPSELGIKVIPTFSIEDIDGKKFYLTHGDGIGKLKPSFKFLRALFRNKFCQSLFSAIHPRWTVPFAYNWSHHSRKAEGQPSPEDATRLTDNFMVFARDYLTKEHIDYFIFGHIHLFRSEQITPDSQVIFLGEWISRCSYARWNGQDLTLHQLPNP